MLHKTIYYKYYKIIKNKNVKNLLSFLDTPKSYFEIVKKVKEDNSFNAVSPRQVTTYLYNLKSVARIIDIPQDSKETPRNEYAFYKLTRLKFKPNAKYMYFSTPIACDSYLFIRNVIHAQNIELSPDNAQFVENDLRTILSFLEYISYHYSFITNKKKLDYLKKSYSIIEGELGYYGKIFMEIWISNKAMSHALRINYNQKDPRFKKCIDKIFNLLVEIESKRKDYYEAKDDDNRRSESLLRYNPLRVNIASKVIIF